LQKVKVVIQFFAVHYTFSFSLVGMVSIDGMKYVDISPNTSFC